MLSMLLPHERSGHCHALTRGVFLSTFSDSHGASSIEWLLLVIDYHIEKMISKPVSGPRSPNSQEDIRGRRTPHDARLAKAVRETGWPLLETWEASPLEAGTVIVYSHNLFHRGNHRRDEHETWASNPRYMFRFFIYRTHDPVPAAAAATLATCTAELEPEHHWRPPSGQDPLTGVDLQDVSSDITAVWTYHSHWLRTGGAVSPSAPMKEDVEARLVRRLSVQLQRKNQPAEVVRIGAGRSIGS
jgi:hypothetical protein